MLGTAVPAAAAAAVAGVLPYTGGDALIYGQSISSEGGLDAVRPLMGVCPQFDVLWGELTGQEHLAIYGHIKGLPFSKVGGCSVVWLIAVMGW
jgi:ABC-type multidrug transport system ATPase subunit